MKKIIFFSILLIMSAESFSQQTNPAPSLTKQDCLQKSQKQKTAAWILLGGGAGLTTVGLFIGINSAAEEIGNIITDGKNDKSFTAGAVLFYTGVAAMAGSIPLFIASAKNKRKAASLSFKNMMMSEIKNSSLVYKPMPAVSFEINL